jgi:tight adherence protein C
MPWFLISLALLAAAAFYGLRAVSYRRLQVETMLARIPGYGYGGGTRPTDARAFLRRLGRIAPGGHGAGADALRQKLAAAGLARQLSPEDVAGLKVTLPAAAVLAMAATAALGLLAPVLALLMAVPLAAAGYVGVPIAIDVRVRGRRDRIVASLPSVLDLLMLSVESGMSFDAALQRVVGRLRGPLIDELAHTMREIQLGTSRHDAFLGLAARADAPEVSSFVRALTQADRLGVPLAHMLRSQADELRVRLRNQAEEHAMRTPVKMLFPTVLLIFPAVFCVVLGPAVISLMDKLGNP